MQDLADLLAAIPLPVPPDDAIDRPPDCGTLPFPCCDPDLVHDLGADLPAGHMHVWGGPAGAGKTSFLLSLLYGAASRGRRVIYASYDLPAETLAMRLLAMAAGVDVEALPDPGGPESPGCLAEGDLTRALCARDVLSRLPFSVLPARGFSTRSLGDRIVRMPFRAEVLAVDYLQAVVREPGTDLGVALQGLSAMAEHLHVAVVCAVRGSEGADGSVTRSAAVASLKGSEGVLPVPDRVGWIAPLDAAGPHRAEVIRNRHGDRPAVHLQFDAASGSLRRAAEGEAAR